MVTQREVLAFLAERTARDRTASAADVRDKFWLSLEAAAGQLRRLWRERLLETTAVRPPRFRFRLAFGESMTSLRFRVTRRGRQRLHWYEGEDDDHGLLFFK